MIITTSQKASATIKDEARQMAVHYNLAYVERRKQPIGQLLRTSSPIAVLSGQGLTIHFNESQQFSFHLSMAQLRLLRIDRGEGDHLVKAVQTLLDSPDQCVSILDCTMGLASDSVVLSYAFPKAHMTAIEASFSIWLATTYGLGHFTHTDERITNALRRITTEHGHFEDIIAELSDKSVDIVYCDPMFEIPVQESPQFIPLRGHTVETKFTEELWSQLQRVARLGIIVKERPFSSIFKNKPPHFWEGGKYSRIGYGVYKEELWNG